MAGSFSGAAFSKNEFDYECRPLDSDAGNLYWVRTDGRVLSGALVTDAELKGSALTIIRLDKSTKTLNLPGSGPGLGEGYGADIVVNDWPNPDLVNVYNDQNWTQPNNVYAGPELSTGPFKEHIRAPTATQKGYIYKTYIAPGKTAAGVIRLAL